ncbi:protein artichoke-like [Coccinella septempunctata]|uniref:protein artichoke-like n=1 Tax=Coccinella septempunctata TaxID=41139 RepID=UPI001D091318|nr:protein artichoke-like [Coccinella septempunctata]
MSHYLVLVFALVWTLVRCSCPTMCNCKNYALDATQNDFYMVATCASLPSNVTEELSEKLKELTLLNLNDTIVDEFETFLNSHLPNLRRLSLRNSSISLGNFTISANITHLDFSGNNLDAWIQPPEDNAIRILDISNNRVASLQNYTFRTLNSLEVLNISFNNVSVLEPYTFSELHNLKCLDLSGNSIVLLTQKVFLPVISLQYLNLSKNHLSVLSETSFEGLNKLQQLDLSWNNLRKLAPGSLELPGLARLFLEGNIDLGKSSDASILVGTGRKLLTVDASHLGLQQVPPSLTPSIRTLRLEGNRIKNINCGDLDSYPLLQMLDFTSNSIDFIEEDALGRLDSLTMLILSDNKIREIPKSLPEKLEVLRIEKNELEQVTEGDLQGLTKLEVLVLNDNKIRIIGARAFSQLTSLVTLDLSRNPVNVLQPGCLQGPVYLQVLRLSGIDLISPAKDVSFPLTAPEHLITLDLSKSPGLARQFLSDVAVLAASKRLQELDLSYTDSDVIRSDLLHYLPQLRSLPLEGNKLNCSHLRWLGAWMRRQDDRRHRNVACASPADLWATLLVDLPEEECETSSVRSIVTRATTLRSSGDGISGGNLILTTERKTTVGIDTSTSTIGVNQDVIPDKLPPETPHGPLTVTTDTNEINSRYSKKTNSILHQKGNNKTGIISKSSYRTVTEVPIVPTPRRKTINSPGIRSRSSYTKVNDIGTYEENPHKEKSTTLYVDIVPNTATHWNGKADELSSDEKDTVKNSYHPGMIILFMSVLIAFAVVAMFASKFNRKRQVREDRDIEVTSIPSITELW